jgi:adenylate kinase family enzyme
MRLLISGGPGSGYTATAQQISVVMGIPLFDSDAFFHKPSDPPFHEPYSPEERRSLLGAALAQASSWIVSGSVATWGLESFHPTHGVLLKVPKPVRLQRLKKRQREQFGLRIDPGGDMHEEHEAFLVWAAAYEERTGSGRNLATDRTFLMNHCDHFISLDHVADMVVRVEEIMSFLSPVDQDGINLKVEPTIGSPDTLED